MKGTVLAVETGPTMRCAALLRDGQLDALEVDRLDENPVLPGALYQCRITGLIAGIGAATADLGQGQTGFFPDATGLNPGESLLAEVRREAEEGKATRLSPSIQLRSTHLVFTPRRGGINVSRKIADEAERARLRDALTPFAAQGGFVIRTQAKNVGQATLADEAAALVARYDGLASDPAPGLRAPALDAVARILDTGSDIGSIIADEASRAVLPADLPMRHDPAPFEALDIDAAVEQLRGPRHDLAEGWLSIDPTPALVAVDVNTGGAAQGKAALRVNLDAAHTIPRLLSLRKNGGLIFVDFAGAPRGQDRKKIAAAFERAALRYLEGVTIFGWGPAGLFEAVCRRPGRPLEQLLWENNP